jgi:hypothetical protein
MAALIQVLALASERLGIGSRMNQSANAIRKQHIDLAWLDQSSHFAGAPDWVTHSLAGAISARSVIGLAVH